MTMTDMTLTADGTAELPEYPMPRAADCPFDPPPALRARQEEGPLTRVRLWDGSTPWLVTRYAEQRALAGDPRVSSDALRPGFPSTLPGSAGGPVVPGFVQMDDPDHARLRRTVQAPFTVKRAQAMRAGVQRIVDGLIEEMLAGPNPVDLVDAFALPVPSLVIGDLLGVPAEDHAFFQRNSKVLVLSTSTREEHLESTANLVDYLKRLVEVKGVTPEDDVLSQLAAQVKAGTMTSHNAAGIGVLLLIAGHETTANMIALGTVALLEHPEQLALLRESDDPKLLSSAVEELLRYLNIVHHGLTRVAKEDIEIGGQVIRAGEAIILNTTLGSRDPAVHPGGGDSLDLGRGSRHHMAFGFGVHQCLGQNLARTELEVVYSTLYRRIPTLRLATSVADIPFKHDVAIYGVHELPVTW